MDEIPVSTPPRNKRKLFIGLGVALLLILIVIGVWCYQGTRAFLLTRVLPAPSAAGVVLVSDSIPAQSILYTDSVEVADGTLISLSKDSLGEVRILERSGEYILSVDGQEVYKADVPLAHAVRSPDGKRIAFSQYVGKPESYISPADVPFIAFTANDWILRVYEPASRTTLDIGQGVGPVFRDAAHLVWAASAGISEVDLQTGSSAVLVEDFTLFTPALALRSPDGTLLGLYNESNHSIILYRLSEGKAEALPVLTTDNRALALALTSDALYRIDTTRWGAKIIRQSFDGSVETVGRIPFFYGVTRLY